MDAIQKAVNQHLDRVPPDDPQPNGIHDLRSTITNAAERVATQSLKGLSLVDFDDLCPQLDIPLPGDVTEPNVDVTLFLLSVKCNSIYYQNLSNIGIKKMAVTDLRGTKIFANEDISTWVNDEDLFYFRYPTIVHTPSGKKFHQYLLVCTLGLRSTLHKRYAKHFTTHSPSESEIKKFYHDMADKV
jgi:hypothetical protein